MNIFVTSFNPSVCALDHCHIHRNKMIVEYAQILSTVHYVYGSKAIGLYKPTHINHPSVKWACARVGNYQWLYQLWASLVSRYTLDTGKVHKSARLLYTLSIPDVNDSPVFTHDMLAMPDEHKTDDVCGSYRSYLNAKYNEWRNRDKPIKVEHTRKPMWAY